MWINNVVPDIKINIAHQVWWGNLKPSRTEIFYDLASDYDNKWFVESSGPYGILVYVSGVKKMTFYGGFCFEQPLGVLSEIHFVSKSRPNIYLL